MFIGETKKVDGTFFYKKIFKYNGEKMQYLICYRQR